MLGKKTRNRKKKAGKTTLTGITLSLLFLAAMLLMNFLAESSASGMDVKSSAPFRSGIKIYDVNVPGSFFTFRNMGNYDIEYGSIVIMINGKNVSCDEKTGILGPGQIAACTSPLVRECNEIEVRTPLGYDSVKCE